MQRQHLSNCNFGVCWSMCTMCVAHQDKHHSHFGRFMIFLRNFNSLNLLIFPHSPTGSWRINLLNWFSVCFTNLFNSMETTRERKNNYICSGTIVLSFRINIYFLRGVITMLRQHENGNKLLNISHT